MKQLLALFGLSGSLFAAELPLTPGQLALEAAANNPELRFFEKQVSALPGPTSGDLPEIPQPLQFPSRDEFRGAILALDVGLARLYLEEFRFVLSGEVRLKSMAYQAAAETSAVAGDLAARITALVKMLEDRPAAGVESLIERRILEGAALPFIKAAAEATLQKTLLRRELNGLLGRSEDSPLSVTGSFAPLPEPELRNPENPLLLSIREANIARGLLGAQAAAETESFSVGGWFTREGLGSYDAIEGTTRPGSTSGGAPAETRTRMLTDARQKLLREVNRRRLAVSAAQDVVKSIPSSLIENLQKASDLAERQYRVGSLGVNLLLETHREYLEALKARNQATVEAWRNILDLEFLDLASAASGKITVTPQTEKPNKQPIPNP